jgi:P4 family phage/plasmid primase-like protien
MASPQPTAPQPPEIRPNDHPLTIARGYLDRGWNPIPVSRQTKKPIRKKWQLRRLDDTTVVAAFNRPDLNIGVQQGPYSNGLTDMDLDCRQAIEIAPMFLPASNNIFGRASKRRSHWLYNSALASKIAKACLQFKDIEPDGRPGAMMLELKIGGGGKGTQSVFPGSVHPSGEAIEWDRDGMLVTVNDDVLLRLLRQVRRLAVAVILARHWPADGSRHDSALTVSGFLARAGFTEDEAALMLEAIAEAAGDDQPEDRAKAGRDGVKNFATGGDTRGLPKLKETFGDKVAKKAAEWLDYNSQQEPTLGDSNEAGEAPFHSEEALALAFAERHTNTLRYVAEWNHWYIWDGTCWRLDQTLQVFNFARALCREKAAEAGSDRERKRIASAKTRAAVVSLAREDRRLAATVDQWDADPWLLNTPGGVVDLRTGKLREHQITHYMTKQTAVTPGGECPRWRLFLQEITGEDEELQKYQQRVSGYFLTGETREQELFFNYGPGENGKGVKVNTIAGILHGYHCAASIETFTVGKFDQHPTELARLRGARLVTAAETEEGRHWAESRIKRLTGGDPIPARFMRQDFFEYIPQFKLEFSGNNMPKLRTVNRAITRRFNRIPFSVIIPPEKKNKNLTDELKAEWPGILAWAIEGCLEWQRLGGLAPPKAVTDSTESYLESEDVLGEWLNDCCIRDANAWEGTTALFNSWKGWAVGREEWIGSETTFSKRLEDRGEFKRRKNTEQTKRGFVGLRLKTPEEKGKAEKGMAESAAKIDNLISLRDVKK